MVLKPAIIFGLLAAISSVTAVELKLCTAEQCEDCPDSLLVTKPTDDRPCIVYARSDIISGGGYPQPSGGAQTVYVNGTPDPNTGIIVRSPADTGAQYCGVAVGTINKADVCGMVSLQDTLTFEICTGVDQCNDEGLPGGPYFPPNRFKIRGSNDAFDSSLHTSGQNFITALRRADGSIITPIAAVLNGEDYMERFLSLFNATEQPEAPAMHEGKVEATSTLALANRAVSPLPQDPKNTPVNGPGDKMCTAFHVDSAPGGYIRSGANTTDTGYTVQATSEGAMESGSYTSETSWTTTVSAGLSFDIFSASVDFSTTQSQSATSGFSINIPPNQSGYIGWTPYYRCASGTATCPSGDQQGEACTAFLDNGDKPAGEYTFVQNFS